MVELHLYQISKMFLLGLEDKEATRVPNLNIQRIINFRSLIRNRKYFLKLVLGSGIYFNIRRVWCYTSKFVEQPGSNISNTRGECFFRYLNTEVG